MWSDGRKIRSSRYGAATSNGTHVSLSKTQRIGPRSYWRHPPLAAMRSAPTTTARDSAGAQEVSRPCASGFGCGNGVRRSLPTSAVSLEKGPRLIGEHGALLLPSMAARSTMRRPSLAVAAPPRCKRVAPSCVGDSTAPFWPMACRWRCHPSELVALLGMHRKPLGVDAPCRSWQKAAHSFDRPNKFTAVGRVSPSVCTQARNRLLATPSGPNPMQRRRPMAGAPRIPWSGWLGGPC